jgi:hypothetical protein
MSPSFARSSVRASLLSVGSATRRLLPVKAVPLRHTREDSLEGLALSDPVIRAVEHEGFYLARSGITVTLGQEPG